jgi:DNA repair protein RecN (Recombination protein N)
MLTDLRIKNFAIIDDLHISFSSGLTILSGETGAGKSIILGALNQVLGGRATGDLIRTGENEAVVEALFDISGDESFGRYLTTKGISPNDTSLLVKRIISREGKNKVIVNGDLATLGMLTALTEPLLTISGQHEHQELLRPQNHIDILDSFGGLLSLRDQYKETFQTRQHMKQELAHLRAEEIREAERKELLSFQWQEIEAAHLVPGEEEELKKEKKILQNVSKLITATQGIYDGIYEGEEAVLSRLNRELRSLREIADIDPAISPHAETLESTLIQLEDVAVSIRDYSQRMQFDPQSLEVIEGRLDALHRLKRKYGAAIAEILACQDAMKEELEQISQRKDRISALEENFKAVSTEAVTQAEELSRKRKETAQTLCQQMENELQTLDMRSAAFDAGITSSESQSLDETGMDQVEFLFSSNPGEEVRPLARIASGGELSRIMLAFRHIFAREEGISTLIFDEVDSGIGGATAEVVGKKLFEISRFYQTICITHLPQIACYGDTHYSISKKLVDSRTKTRVK